MPVYTIFELSLERDPSTVRCSWKRHLEEHSTKDVVLLGAVPGVFPNSLSGKQLAELGGCEHLMKRSDDTCLVMISGRGDGGGK